MEYHVELIDLLAKCAEDNYELKILCKTILSFEGWNFHENSLNWNLYFLDIVHQLVKLSLSLTHKVPFVHLLNEVYVNSKYDSQSNSENFFPPQQFSMLLIAIHIDIGNISSSTSK